MTKEQILDWWFTPDINSNPYIYTKEKDGIYEIHKISLMITRSKDAFAYIVNYPGPICDIYRFEDYGTTWAFTQEELENKWINIQQNIRDSHS